ncbi:Co2+/Mg2+ efflux protein ApaG [Sandaracinobacter sp. RS1-74]|uniref:Co2+/Mg2+ efflux protein ApaG n=1 Tax=Sandaracinobacteroides sayramensis TaxID=2913411 RepID=UPI001ED9EFB6|nr:Co2+/Mg2+ efflux protein ApaG [Sandaracinobacteroides sayramensis]MCG2841682.1 Co2+/Mg2+ efflux protein ApaG [Sandaracinobacteroides sayramensis]
MPGLFSAVATTEGIIVRVQPRYAGDQSDPENGHWVWHYHIRIENGSGVTVRLIDRAWVIVDGNGARRDVMGEGVVGEQPEIHPGESYDYVSGCPLSTPMGHMRGRYGMEDKGGRRFEVEIPGFDLISPDTKGAAN